MIYSLMEIAKANGLRLEDYILLLLSVLLDAWRRIRTMICAIAFRGIAPFAQDFLWCEHRFIERLRRVADLCGIGLDIAYIPEAPHANDLRGAVGKDDLTFHRGLDLYVRLFVSYLPG